MQKNYDVILREASFKFINEASLLFEQENPEQTVMRLQQQLSQLQPGTPQHSQVQAQLQAAQQRLSQWQAQQRSQAQQQASMQEPSQGPDLSGAAGSAVNAVGMASTVYGASDMMSAAGKKMKQAGKFVGKNWNKLGSAGKVGVVGGGIALAGLAAWKIKKMRCRKKCQDLGDMDQIQQCMQKC